MLDMQPIKDIRQQCFEDVIASLCRWLSRDYEMIFNDAWYFSLKPKETDRDLLYKRIVTAECNILLKLSEYHGVKLNYHTWGQATDMFAVIEHEIAFRKPVVLCTSSYWCPWSPYYQKDYMHVRHAFLVVGTDRNTDSFICTDPFFTKYQASFPLSEIKAEHTHFFTTELMDVDMETGWEQVLMPTVTRLKSPAYSFCDTFEAIRHFGDEIMNLPDILAEMKNNLLGNMLRKIDYGRRGYSILLEYLGKKHRITDLLALSDSILEAASRWNGISSLLLKACYHVSGSSNYNIAPLLARAGQRIMELADFEEGIADRLEDLISKGSTSPKATVASDRQFTLHDTKVDNLEFLDLSKHFNNKAFANDISPTCTADISGTRAYILSKNLPSDRIWHINDMIFCFPNVLDAGNDNVSCQNQIVYVPSRKYSKIMVLGCTVWGSQCEIVTIEYEGGHTEDIYLEFTDLYLPQACFGEVLAWQGHYVARRKPGEAVLLPNKINIYAQSHTVDITRRMKAIYLPNCANMHIFSISLLKGSVNTFM